ncbi:497_t:CDS:10, partial [Ambispora gerdemannii]
MENNSTIVDAKNEQAETTASTSNTHNATTSKELPNSPLNTYSFQISKYAKAKTGEHNKIKYTIVKNNTIKKYNTTSNVNNNSNTNNKKFKEESNSEPTKKKRGRKKKVEDEDYEPPKKMRGRKKKVEDNDDDEASKERSIAKWVNGIFKDLRIFIMPQNIDRVRLELLKTRIKERGGLVLEVFVILDVTHIITELKGKKVIRGLNINKADELLEHGIKVINANWISDSVMYNKLLEIDDYVVHLNGIKPREITIDQTTSTPLKLDEKNETKRNDEMPTENYNSGSDSEKSFLYAINISNNNDGSKSANTSQDPLKEIIAEARHLTEEGIYSDEEDEDYDREESSVSNTSARHYETLDSDNEEETSGSHSIANNICEHDQIPKNENNHNKPVSPIKIDENPNKLIIDKLNLILEHYQKTSKDQWRVIAYRKAISALKKQINPITSFEEANKIPGIGDRTAKKIAEIIETGHLKRLDNFGEAEPVLTMFTQIHGVGVNQALKWYAQGYRTREELLRNVKLTHAQKAGILYFEDLQERMSRDEVTKIFKFIEDAAHSIDSKLE